VLNEWLKAVPIVSAMAVPPNWRRVMLFMWVPSLAGIDVECSIDM
jgi:hypothetical protein